MNPLDIHTADLRQTCKECNLPQYFEFGVEDGHWAEVVPERHYTHALCLHCFEGFANAAGITIDISWVIYCGERQHINLVPSQTYMQKEEP